MRAGILGSSNLRDGASFTVWVYAGLAIVLLLAFYSQLNGGGSTWDKFDPILVVALVFASYVLRCNAGQPGDLGAIKCLTNIPSVREPIMLHA